MYVDARSLDDGRKIVADVCIVGAGAAGITLAMELGGRGLSVALLESGGFEVDGDTQRLYDGENVGHPYYALAATRLRFFGGTTNHWSGWCRPLDDDDFAARAWIPYSGWPIGRADLDDYYVKAHEICQLGPFDYTPADWSGDDGTKPLPLAQDAVETRLYQFSPPTRFGLAYRNAVESAEGVTTYLWTNLTELEPDPETGRVRRAHLATLSGRRFSVDARLFVLAAGGIENPRLMLASRSLHAEGIGNAHGLVGRYFMEHLHLAHATFTPERAGLDLSFYRPRTVRDVKVMGTLVVSQPVRAREGIAAVSSSFTRSWTAKLSDGSQSLALLYRTLGQGQIIDDFGTHVWNVVTDIDDVVVEQYRRYQKQPLTDEVYAMDTRAGQMPNPDSRVTLAEEKDALGMPHATLDWQLTDLDIQTLTKGQRIIADTLADSQLGQTQLPEDDEDAHWSQYVLGGSHHMGTTRMSDDPRQGVVDRHCQVHDVGNLYIAGSSVFTTSGYANPTLTIVALAIRLADRVKEVLA